MKEQKKIKIGNLVNSQLKAISNFFINHYYKIENGFDIVNK